MSIFFLCFFLRVKEPLPFFTRCSRDALPINPSLFTLAFIVIIKFLNATCKRLLSYRGRIDLLLAPFVEVASVRGSNHAVLTSLKRRFATLTNYYNITHKQGLVKG